MKYRQVNNSRYAILINCGQQVLTGQLYHLKQAHYPERELVCCLSKEAAVHFTGTARIRINPNVDPEGDCSFLA